MNTPDDNESFVQNEFGYCFYTFDNFPLIYGLYVYPEYRRQGKAKQLLQEVIDIMNEVGYDEIYIEAKPKDNSIGLTELVDFYEKMGLIIF